jgi:hypothetical protein
MAELLEEFQMIRPTQLSAAPSVYSMLHGKFKTLLHLTMEEQRLKGSHKTPEEIEEEVV